MKIMVRNAILLAMSIAGFATGAAACEIDFSDFLDYEFVFEGEVTGYIDDHGEEKESFYGCKQGRQLILDNRFRVTCKETWYDFGFRPNIIILDNGHEWEACIAGRTYEVSP